MVGLTPPQILRRIAPQNDMMLILLGTLSIMCDREERVFSPISNLRQPMPLGRKLRLILSNQLKRIKNRQSCCGNYGQPGC
jgi:hypothetical protein